MIYEKVVLVDGPGMGQAVCLPVGMQEFLVPYLPETKLPIAEYWEDGNGKLEYRSHFIPIKYVRTTETDEEGNSLFEMVRMR